MSRLRLDGGSPAGGTWSVTMRMKPPGVIERLWYWRLRRTPPLEVGRTGPRHSVWVRLLPYRWRRLHRAYAAAFGFFWIPCVLCDRPFGGHEGGDTVPNPLRAPNGGIVICSRCTIARNRSGIPALDGDGDD